MVAVEARALTIEPSKPTSERTTEPCIVGDSLPMRELLETVARIGPKDITVLVRGETGTGKELIASLVHEQSNRSSGPLVRFNCAAIPGELAEAELFGHARGAFTGAAQARRGFFALAATLNRMGGKYHQSLVAPVISGTLYIWSGVLVSRWI